MAKIKTKDDSFDFSSLDGFDPTDPTTWTPQTIDPISSDPSLGMVTPPDSTGIGDMTDIFNVSNGGIGNMTPDQLSQLASSMGMSPGALSSALGLTSNLAGHSTGGASGGSSLLGSLLGPNPLASLLPMLLGAGGALLNHNATNSATQQVIQGLNNASTQAQGILGGAQQNYQPFMQAGTTALSKLAGMGNSNIAGMFKPLGSGKYTNG